MKSEILNASSIYLKVFGPEIIYGNFDLRWLEEFINDELAMFLGFDHSPKIKMDFRFKILPIAVISKEASWSSTEILNSLASRAPVYV